MFWRTKPTEGLTKTAFEMLQRESGSEHRWPTLGKTVSNGGFPFFAWYVSVAFVGITHCTVV